METKLIENKDTTLNGHRPQSLVTFISHDNIRHNIQTHPIFAIMLSTTPEFDRVLSSVCRVAAWTPLSVLTDVVYPFVMLSATWNISEYCRSRVVLLSCTCTSCIFDTLSTKQWSYLIHTSDRCSSVINTSDCLSRRLISSFPDAPIELPSTNAHQCNQQKRNGWVRHQVFVLVTPTRNHLIPRPACSFQCCDLHVQMEMTCP